MKFVLGVLFLYFCLAQSKPIEETQNLKVVDDAAAPIAEAVRDEKSSPHHEFISTKVENHKKEDTNVRYDLSYSL